MELGAVSYRWRHYYFSFYALGAVAEFNNAFSQLGEEGAPGDILKYYDSHAGGELVGELVQQGKESLWAERGGVSSSGRARCAM